MRLRSWSSSRRSSRRKCKPVRRKDKPMSQSLVADTSTSSGAAPARPDYLNVETTVLSWLLTTDHKRIGVMFLVMLIATMFLGGVFAMLLRIELLTPGPTIVNATDY